MVIYRFFQDGGRPPSWICNAWVVTTHERHLVVFITVKFGWNRCSSFDNMHVFRFREFGLKTPIDHLLQIQATRMKRRWPTYYGALVIKCTFRGQLTESPFRGKTLVTTNDYTRLHTGLEFITV